MMKTLSLLLSMAVKHLHLIKLIFKVVTPAWLVHHTAQCLGFITSLQRTWGWGGGAAEHAEHPSGHTVSKIQTVGDTMG